MSTPDSIVVTLFEGPLPKWDPPSLPCMTGAWIVFEGIVRPEEDGQSIGGLHYEAYLPMAQKQLERLAGQVMECHRLLSVTVQHSRGWVPAGSCSFRLAVASMHRKEAFKAMDHFIDAMKRDVPIWKHGPSGAHT